VWRKGEEGVGAVLPAEDITKAAPTSKSLAAHPSRKFMLVSVSYSAAHLQDSRPRWPSAHRISHRATITSCDAALAGAETHLSLQDLDMSMQDDVYTPLQRWHKQYKHIKVRHSL
jgi:hypothetical protein